MKQAFLPVALAAAVAVTGVARRHLEPEAARAGQVRDPAWLPSGQALRTTSFGQRLLLADFYWLSTVMYVGEAMLAPDRGWEALHPLGEIVTDLAPRFGYAYQVVGSNLSGRANQVERSNRILEKGMRNVPDRWSLPFLYGFNKFFYEHDYATAAEYVRRAGEIGKRPHLALLAANLSLVANQADEYPAAIAFLELNLQQADTPEMREQLAARLIKVRAFAELARCEHAVAAFRARFGRSPWALDEGVLNGFLAAVPVDPAGGQIVYEFATDTVRSTVLGPRKPFRIDTAP
jgi:tetratricopeptide (TPR) repeat protein